MANVEVQLDIKAEYKQALSAIAMLRKALDAVQQRAKVALSVAGGAQGGSQGAGSTGETETKQKAAVEALSAAMKDAAGAAASMAESIGKLTPALEAMGPQAEQVQQVLTLAEHYKQLANSMGVAADAAAKYNASGAQQGETDARIQKLMEENQKLMELVSNIRAEYAEIVKRNAELNRTKTAREESARSAREELEAEQDLSYQMALSVMSKRELIAEIQRLTKEREEAAKVKDQKLWEEKTEELKLARQALTKLRQEQQLSRIAWMQQAQTAQQMGQSVRTLADGFLNFGESIENGTVNLTGMVSAVTSLSLAIKAGLGPLGWALAAVELLTTAWNMYAKSQKEAEEAEKKRQERIVKLTTAYHEAAAAAKEFHEEEERKFVLEKTQEWYANLNKELEIARDYTNEIYRNEQARLTLLSKEDELEFTLERNKIQRDYIAGKISEEQRDEKLDELNIKKTQRKALRTQEDNESDIKKAYEDVKKTDTALKNAEKMLKVEQQGRRYKVSLADSNMYYTQAEGMKNRYEARAFLEEKLGKFAPEEFEQYALLHKAEEERVRVAEEAVRDLRRQAETAARQYETAKNNAETAEALSEQAIKHAQALAEDNKATRVVVQEAKMRKDAEKQAAVARKEAERRAKLQSDAIAEGEYEGNLTKQARAIAKGKGYKMLADNRLSEAELKALIAAAQNNAENEAFLALVRDILQTAINNKNITSKKLGEFRQKLEKANINNID